MWPASPAPLLTYAAPDDPLPKQAVIRLVERLSGRARLERLYGEVRRSLRPGDNVWARAVHQLRLRVPHDADRLAAVPRQGPLVVVANHPFGVIDGLVLCYLTSLVRPDLKVVAMSTLRRVPEVRPYVLPIDFAGTREALAESARSRTAARAHLARGGCLVIFPAGAVSTSRTPLGPAVDADWHPFVGRLVAGAGATVLPVYFAGQNTRLFQLASRISPTLRLALLMREAARRVGREVEVGVGAPVPFDSLRGLDGAGRLAEHLRDVTYGIRASMPRRRVRLARRLPAPSRRVAGRARG